MNYLYGFLSSAVVYSLLHWAVPDKRLDAFLKGSASAKELQQLYSGRWDLTEAQAQSSDEQLSADQDKAASV